MDEILFSGAYKGWEHSVKYAMDGSTDLDAAYALCQIRENIEHRAFCHAGVDCTMIESLVPEGKGMQDAIRLLESRKPGEWKEALLKSVKNEALLPVAESKLVCAVLSKNGLSASPCVSMLKSPIKPQSQEPLEGVIAFISRYKDWVAVKKMGVDSGTADYEVAGILSAINSPLVRKAFDFANPDRQLEKVAEDITRGKRKSFPNLSEAFRKISPIMGASALNDAYLLKIVCERLNFIPYANVESMVAAHPDLKVAKPRGRKAKK